MRLTDTVRLARGALPARAVRLARAPRLIHIVRVAHVPHLCRAAAGAALLCAGLVATAGCGDEPAPAATRLTVWSEFLPAERVVADLPALAAARTDLNLGITRCDAPPCDDIGIASLEAAASVVAAAEEAGVTVRLWPELPLAEGRWANVKTIAGYAAHFRALLAFVRERRLPAAALVVDLETSYQKLLQIQDYVAQNQLTELVDFLRQDSDETSYQAAKEELRALIEEGHAQGFEVHVSTLAPVLDDGDDEGIQRALDVPVDGLPWDRVSVQIYRTLFDELYAASIAGAEQGFAPDVVYSYARSAVLRYGERAALDLGIIAAPGTFTGYETPDGLAADIAAARAAGIRYGHLQIFALDGLDGRGDYAAWLPPDPGAGAPPPPDSATDKLRNTFTLLDLAMQ